MAVAPDGTLWYIERAGIPAAAVDEVIFGHARQAGNGPNMARQIGRRAGLADDVRAAMGE